MRIFVTPCSFYVPKCVMEKHVVFLGIKMSAGRQTLSKTRTVQIMLVGPRSNVVSPHGIVV